MVERGLRKGVVSRRSVLVVGGAAAAVSALAGCDALSTEPEEQGGGRQSGPKGAEAPMLAERVKAGDLPRVEERIPADALVIEPTESVGLYGGTWNSWLHGAAAIYVFMVQTGYEPLVRWDPEWEEIIPNIAESWDIGADGREYTFVLREGMRWSNGDPFTADDVVFSYRDVISNRDIYPVHPNQFVAGGEPATIEKVDDYTVKFTFAVSNGVFLQHLATANGGEYLTVPRAYMSEFHQDFNDHVDAVVAEEQAADWVELFLGKNDRWINPDRPTINAWFITAPVGEGARTVFERNPYYWKVDPDGSQLPYIDRVSYEVIGDLEVALLKTANGEIHFNHPTFTGGLTTAANKETLAKNREAGGYDFVDSTSSSMNLMSIGLNLNHPDPDLREIFGNRDFRIGLSHAINRQEIIDVVYRRQGEPWQAAPREESEYYIEELAKQYTEYDTDLANEHLDRAGLSERNSGGFRERPDGSQLSFGIGVVTEEPQQIDALEMVSEYWREVGIDMTVQVEDRTLHVDRRDANKHDAYVWTGDGGLRDGLLNPGWFFPFSTNGWAPLWARWYQSGGESGEEPIGPVREQMRLYDEVKKSVDPGRQRELFMAMLEIAREEFWVIGTILPVGLFGTVRNDFRNVPEWIPGSWLYPSPGPTRPEQYYIAD